MLNNVLKKINQITRQEIAFERDTLIELFSEMLKTSDAKNLNVIRLESKNNQLDMHIYFLTTTRDDENKT
jgi:hypothetical protein